MSQSSRPGVFTISLDTELAWGTFDVGGISAHSSAYERTPHVIERLCSLFDEHEIPATWALVAHLLEDCSSAENPHSDQRQPDFDWIEDWFGSVPCVNDCPNEFWHAPTLVDQIQSCSIDHEIGLHGYSHMILGDDGCSVDAARDEVASAVEILRSLGVDPDSYVYPRDRVGHRDVLAEQGIDIYRSRTARPFVPAGFPVSLRRPLRFLVEAASVTPRAVVPHRSKGLVGIPGSQVFRPENSWWTYTPENSQVERAFKGLHRAADSGRIFHLWFHPFNLAYRTESVFADLKLIFEEVTRLREAGRIEVMTMRQVGAEFEVGRWEDS